MRRDSTWLHDRLVLLLKKEKENDWNDQMQPVIPIIIPFLFKVYLKANTFLMFLIDFMIFSVYAIAPGQASDNSLRVRWKMRNG